jgi:hypothetical protein
MNKAIIPIVEGQSEVISVPLLLRRIMHEIMHVWDVEVAKPFLVKRNKVVKEGELERAIKQSLRAREGEGFTPGSVIVLLDTDPDSCPVRLAEILKERAQSVTGLPVGVVLPQMEFEAWFLAVKDSLRGECGIRNDAGPPETPERIRAAKGALSRNMVEGRRYLEIQDQPTLVQRMDLAACRDRSRSFKKLVRELTDLIEVMRETKTKPGT